MSAAIDLEDLVDSLKAEVNVPGIDSFPGATAAEWKARLQNAFWNAMWDGVISGYSEDDGTVTPDSGDTPLSRELQQIIVFYAGMNVVRNQLRTLNTTDKAKAGPVEYEIQKSAQLLKGILEEMTERRNILLSRLSDMGESPSYYTDMLAARDYSLNLGITSWIGS